MKAILIIAAFVAVCSAYSFTGNFSSQLVINNGWQFRSNDFYNVNLNGLYLGANVYSVNLSASATSGFVDAVTASAYIPIFGYPFAYVAYFKANYSVSGWGTIGQGAAKFDVNAAAGYIATAALYLQEKTPSGAVVATRSLKWNIINSISYSQTGVSKPGDDIQYVTFTGTANDNFQFKVTYLSSARAGIVDKTIPLVPGSLESIYEISNYPYKNASNTLSLTIGIGSGDASATASGQTLVSNDTVYFSLNAAATVNGAQKDVAISAFVAGSVSDLENADFSGQLNGRYGSKANVHLVTITFPPGATTIVYDPTIGAGARSAEEVHSSTSSASVIAPLVSVVVLVSAFLMA